MSQRTIQICYRKLIDSNSLQPWEKLVFEDTYTEFRMQAQFYNQEKKYQTFSDLILNVPGAKKLHFLVSTAAAGYVKQLNNIVPDVLNTLGKHFLPFKNFRFEIINSHILNKAAHQIAVNFYSTPLLWHDTVDNKLLVSLQDDASTKEHLTEMFQLQPMVTIYSLKQVS